MREKCPYSEFFWSVFSRIRAKMSKNVSYGNAPLKFVGSEKYETDYLETQSPKTVNKIRNLSRHICLKHVLVCLNTCWFWGKHRNLQKLYEHHFCRTPPGDCFFLLTFYVLCMRKRQVSLLRYCTQYEYPQNCELGRFKFFSSFKSFSNTNPPIIYLNNFVTNKQLSK